MKKIIIMLSLLVAVVCSRCEKDTIPNEANHKADFTAAKIWFENYKSQKTFNPLFEYATYDWDAAYEKRYDDGAKAIVVPVTSALAKTRFESIKNLYLYPNEKEGYQTALFEILPAAGHKKANKGVVNLDNFDGMLIDWDVEKGFVKGAQFAKSKWIRDLTHDEVETKTSYRNEKKHVVGEEGEEEPKPKTIPGGELATVVITAKDVTKPRMVVYFSYSYTTLGISKQTKEETPITSGGGGGGSANSYTKEDPKKHEQKIDPKKLPPCVQSILAKLTGLKQRKFKQIFEKFGGIDGEFIINFEVVDLIDNDPTKLAETNFAKDDQYYTKFDILVKKDYLNEGTDISIAATILHEMAHAYLINLVGDRRYKGSDEINSYPNMFDSYVKLLNIENPQHEDIAGKLLYPMAGALQEYATKIPVPEGTKPDQFYTDLAWGGLYETKTFQEVFKGKPEDKLRIFDANKAEDTNVTQTDWKNNSVKPKGTPCKK
jgi:hypothetical protein